MINDNEYIGTFISEPQNVTNDNGTIIGSTYDGSMCTPSFRSTGAEVAGFVIVHCALHSLLLLVVVLKSIRRSVWPGRRQCSTWISLKLERMRQLSWCKRYKTEY